MEWSAAGLRAAIEHGGSGARDGPRWNGAMLLAFAQATREFWFQNQLGLISAAGSALYFLGGSTLNPHEALTNRTGRFLEEMARRGYTNG